jgi:plastocyanin
MKMLAAGLSAALIGALALAVPALAANPKLSGTVGPSFTISMAKKPSKAGTYTLVVDDKATSHNFRLKGPGVNVATNVSKVEKKTFTVKLKKGKYTFLCDPHATSMVGTFTIK